MNTGALAYIGDAVYEVYIRKHTIGKGQAHGDFIHKKSTKYVNAFAQCKAMKTMFDSLSEDDQTLVKRARNKKISSKPQNVDPITYKWATAFEALIGEYYLNGEYDKLDRFIEKAIAIIDG